MFPWCFRRQTSDEEEYRQRPKTRNTLNATNSQNIVTQTSAAATISAGAQKFDENVKNLEKMQKECLEAHNKFRAKHGVPPLTLNKQLSSYATEWAKHLASGNKLQHRKNNKYGENLYFGTGMGPQTHELAVQAWYDEIKNYNFNKPGFSPHNGHFTQVIWKTSRELGVGIETRNNQTWVVCNYNPPGNIMGNYAQCVPALIEATASKVIEKMKPRNSLLKSTSKTFKTEQANDVTPTYSRKDLKLWSLFELECLDSHNKFRALHGSPTMKLNRKLCNLAQDWSKQLAKRGALQHRPNNDYGENIYYGMNFDPSAESCVKSWYDEIEKYNFSNPGFSSQTGHFTQVVWRDSIELGVGVTKLNNMTFVVCNYSPAGNVMNEYKIQVPRPGAKPMPPNDSKATTSNGNQQTFEEVCLDSHNNIRAIHGSPPMTLNENLNFLAKDWAQHLATTNTFEPRKNNRFGENIFYAINSPAVNGHDPVEYWYSSGVQHYNFERPGHSDMTANFTQVIWKSSKQLGVGIAKVGRSTYVVCNYDPKGNIVNEFAENVASVGSGGGAMLTSKHYVPLKIDEFAAEILENHNIYRANHGCAPLQLSQELMDFALHCANQLVDNKTLSDPPDYIIYPVIFEGITPSADLIVSSWYDEIEKYDFQNPGYSSFTKHFTQIIWKNTKYLGVGVGTSDQKTVTVLSYEPPGNIENLYEENVLPEI